MLLQKAIEDGGFAEPFDPYSLVARALAGHEGDVAARDVEGIGEEGNERVVGGTVHRRSGEPDQDGVTPCAVHAGARRARDDADEDVSSRLVALQGSAAAAASGPPRA